MWALGWWRPRGAQAIHTVCWSLKQLALPGGDSAAGGKTSCSHFPGGRAVPPPQPGWPAPGLWVCTPVEILNGEI